MLKNQPVSSMNISSYADITQAIHVMQESMGLQAQQAKEAKFDNSRFGFRNEIILE